MVGVVAISGGDPRSGDKTLPTVAACLDATFRRLGGVPVYVLTDNEKTATIDHVAGIAVRQSGDRGGGTALRHDAADVFTC